MDNLPPRDHNAPDAPTPLSPAQVNEYLDYAGSGLKERRDELLASFKVILDGLTEIRTNDELATLGDNKELIRALNKTAEGRRVEVKQPFLDGGKAVDGWFKRLMEPLEEPRAKIQSLMDDYGHRLEAAERAKREAAAKIARDEAARLAAEAAEAMRREQEALRRSRANQPVAPVDPSETDRALELAEKAAEAAQHAEAAAKGKASDFTRVTGTYGKTTSMVTRWKARIVDKAKVPEKYKVVENALVAADIRAAPKLPNGRPDIEIAGIEIYPESSFQ